IASKMEIDTVFPEKGQSQRKKQFDENDDHEETFQYAKESFRMMEWKSKQLFVYN
ncbi:hypothetical protein GBA52_009088, partial [Prunus armeniaca]